MPRGSNDQMRDTQNVRSDRHTLHSASNLTNKVVVIVLVMVVVFVVSMLPSTSLALALTLALTVGLLLWESTRMTYFADLSSRDTLTGLHNKGSNDEDLKRLVKAGHPFAVFYMDVDRFKLINDNHGHAAGDTVLRDFSESIVRYTGPQDCAYRVGGDEFVIVCDRPMTVEQCEAMAEGFQRAVEHPVRCGDANVTPRTSVGYARFPEDASDGESLREAADKMMYARKELRHAKDKGNELYDARRRVSDFDLYTAMMTIPVPYVMCRCDETLDILFVNVAALRLLGADSIDALLTNTDANLLGFVIEDDRALLTERIRERVQSDVQRSFMLDAYNIQDMNEVTHTVSSIALLTNSSRYGLIICLYLTEEARTLS